MKKLLFFVLANILIRSTHSQNVPSVVASVDMKRYAGTWYEIARLPNFFEKKLKCITATYSLRGDGKIKVLNKGYYITSPGKSNSAEGVACIPDKSSPGKLKVRFFWPFSGDYWIMFLDQDYRYVLVGDPSRKYLWILSRENNMNEETYRMLLQKAVNNGYDVKSIIRVEHNCN